MKMCLMAASLLVVAVMGFASASPSPVGREMTSAESWSKLGGFGVKCVASDPQCVNDYPALCSTQAYTACYMEVEITDNGGNKLYCKNQMTMDRSCTDSGTSVCLVYRGCRWDVDTNKCVRNTGLSNNYASTVAQVGGSLCP